MLVSASLNEEDPFSAEQPPSLPAGSQDPLGPITSEKEVPLLGWVLIFSRNLSAFPTSFHSQCKTLVASSPSPQQFGCWSARMLGQQVYLSPKWLGSTRVQTSFSVPPAMIGRTEFMFHLLQRRSRQGLSLFLNASERDSQYIRRISYEHMKPKSQHLHGYCLLSTFAL